ncbi:hypothetical protein B0F90DRAFT_1822384 [Multifurca ochricompacta]|uniref:Uncharacterized protein n=1 Tax=Multifurca ochricompacta TaxID=376703 RepID=A0AAD4LWE4_9AGAM|nr:hypothetical protein B0F90DRAFT_1822384 [Multifurca ochricompacta]
MGGPPLHPEQWDDDYVPLSSPPAIDIAAEPTPPLLYQQPRLSGPPQLVLQVNNPLWDNDPPCTTNCADAVIDMAPVYPLDIFMSNIQIPAVDIQLVNMPMEQVRTDLIQLQHLAAGHSLYYWAMDLIPQPINDLNMLLHHATGAAVTPGAGVQHDMWRVM